jgi:hypothetical protein
MKKLILIIVSILTITNVFAQSGTMTIVNSAKQAVNETIDSTKKAVSDGTKFVDTSSNFKMIYNDVKSNIAGLASALKVGAEHVYLVLVKQQIVYSIVWLILTILSVFILKYIIKITKWAYETKVINLNNEGITLGLVFGWIGSIVYLLIVIFHLDTMITGFVNPEYGAIMDIVNFVK